MTLHFLLQFCNHIVLPHSAGLLYEAPPHVHSEFKFRLVFRFSCRFSFINTRAYMYALIFVNSATWNINMQAIVERLDFISYQKRCKQCGIVSYNIAPVSLANVTKWKGKRHHLA